MNKLAPIALACCSMLLLSSCQEAKPSASSVVQVPFRETESFPFPFDEALPMGEENEGFLMSVDQMLYDYDTMWQLLEDNFPFWTAVEQEMDGRQSSRRWTLTGGHIGMDSVTLW